MTLAPNHLRRRGCKVDLYDLYGDWYLLFKLGVLLYRAVHDVDVSRRAELDLRPGPTPHSLGQREPVALNYGTRGRRSGLRGKGLPVLPCAFEAAMQSMQSVML